MGPYLCVWCLWTGIGPAVAELLTSFPKSRRRTQKSLSTLRRRRKTKTTPWRTRARASHPSGATLRPRGKEETKEEEREREKNRYRAPPAQPFDLVDLHIAETRYIHFSFVFLFFKIFNKPREEENGEEDKRANGGENETGGSAHDLLEERGARMAKSCQKAPDVNMRRERKKRSIIKQKTTTKKKKET